MKDASAPGRLSGFARGRGRRSCSSRHRGVLLLGKLHRKDGQLVEKFHEIDERRADQEQDGRGDKKGQEGLALPAVKPGVTNM